MNQFTKLFQINETNSSVNDNVKIQDLYNHLPKKLITTFRPKISISEQGHLVLTTDATDFRSLQLNESLLVLPEQHGFDKFNVVNARNVFMDISDVNETHLPHIIKMNMLCVTASTLMSSKFDSITFIMENNIRLPEFTIHIDDRFLNFSMVEKFLKIAPSNTRIILHIFLNELFAPSITNLDSIIGMRKNIDTILFDSYDFLAWDENGKIDVLNDTIEKYLRSGNANEFIDEIIDAGMEDWL